ncbi:MAG: GFA family protein [Sphingomonadaceae bacterium]|nr:GFA family protein [Sphingomonadaceae bacterium]
MGVRASCHCGAVVFEVAHAPTDVNECLCSICRRYGALWAYYRPGEVRFGGEGGSDTYVWGDRQLAFHRCRTCGCMTHWSSVDPAHDRMGVNVRLMSPEMLRAATIRQSQGPE